MPRFCRACGRPLTREHHDVAKTGPKGHVEQRWAPDPRRPGVGRWVTNWQCRVRAVARRLGTDLETAQALNRQLLEVASESQIYRIDHYLGKETVQNLLVFRFANGIFEPVWNRRYVSHVQMTVAEEVGIETRGAYYDQAGALVSRLTLTL